MLAALNAVNKTQCGTLHKGNIQESEAMACVTGRATMRRRHEIELPARGAWMMPSSFGFSTIGVIKSELKGDGSLWISGAS